MLRDLKSNVQWYTSLLPQVITTGTPDGAGVDRAGCSAVVALLVLGTQAGTSNTFNLMESDDNSNFTAVSTADLGGVAQPAAITTSLDKKTFVRVYTGTKRYLRWSATASSSGNIPACGLIGLGLLRNAPATEEAPQ